MGLLTQDEVAVILRCHAHTVARIRKRGEIPFIPGRPVRFRSEDVDLWIKKHLTRGGGNGREGNATRSADAARAEHEAGGAARGRRIAAMMQAKRAAR